MSSYWVSEDGKAKAETLESYLYRYTKETQISNHQLTASFDESGEMLLTIKPNADSTEQLEFKVDDNQLYPADPAFTHEMRKTLLFMVSSDGKVFKPMTTGLYLNLLERLYVAVKGKDETTIQNLVKAIEEWEEEWT